MRYPKTREQWTSLVLCILGCWCGYVRGPLALLAFGPLRLACAVWAMCAQESNFERNVAGDRGASVGLLQWNDANDTVPLDMRTSAFWSGFYVPVEIQEALVTSLWWWALALPGAGFYVLRFLWVNGPSDVSAKAALFGDERGNSAWRQARLEEFAPRTWLYARGAVLLGLGVALAVGYSSALAQWAKR